MAIKNSKPNFNQENNDQKKEGIIKRSSTEPLPNIDATQTNKNLNFKIKLRHIILLFLLLSIIPASILGYKNIQNTKNIKAEKLEITAIDIEKIIRTHGYINLLEKKILQNEEILKKTKDESFSTAIKLSLTKNLEDLKKQQNNYINLLIEIKSSYDSNPEATIDFIKKRNEQSKQDLKSGNIDALNELMELITTVPKDISARNHFEKIIKTP